MIFILFGRFIVVQAAVTSKPISLAINFFSEMTVFNFNKKIEEDTFFQLLKFQIFWLLAKLRSVNRTPKKNMLQKNQKYYSICFEIPAFAPNE